MSLPTAARRLFPNHPVEGLAAGNAEGLLLERLLEDGDREDLRWLTSELSEKRLALWLSERGARQLSDRSRAFWSVVLGLPAPARRTKGDALWPL